MKRIGLIFTALLICSFLRAQEVRDSVAVYDVFENLSGNLQVRQSREIHDAMNAHVERNEKRAAAGHAGQS